ncbi:hypothetical protein Tco_0143013, partial [Tanacetum coccineum]
EAVHKEMGDSLVRVATTASSLEAKQEIGNITKTRSKEIPNEAGSQRTTSGGGPKHQETIGDKIAQTRFENVSKLSNDSLLARVLDLKKAKTTQAEEIVSLNRRVDSSEEEEVLGEDASKQGRSDNVDTLFSGQDEEMLNDGKEVVVVEEI